MGLSRLDAVRLIAFTASNEIDYTLHGRVILSITWLTLATREPSFDALRDHCLKHMSQYIAVTEPAMAVL